ncbi:hypothetical protein [Nonomuraea helvata]|uniref:Uncharacterized protein n=1 Tax=Nonomuraea helvata TaxID=37484 RepID=A0ABV5SCA4_9ACTN
MAPLDGTYEGASPTGLLWSMRPAEPPLDASSPAASRIRCGCRSRWRPTEHRWPRRASSAPSQTKTFSNVPHRTTAA